MRELPLSQSAVQLLGRGELRVVEDKPVTPPKEHQILAKIESTGLCFSDLKLIRQFSGHPRKGAVIRGMEAAELLKIPSYVPDEMPTVPGHECVVRIVAVGDKVSNHKVGDRRMVQTDYRNLITAGGSNASFGYNFEGGLQEYVIIDERVARDAQTGESFLIPVPDEKSASAICLVEPWACVEDAYANPERRHLKQDGRLLIVADQGRAIEGLAEAFSLGGVPGRIGVICPGATQRAALESGNIPVKFIEDNHLTNEDTFDDIIYFGVDPKKIGDLGARLAAGGIINIVTAGRGIGAPAAIDIGRIHYSGTRWIGAASANAADGYRMIPASKEIRDGENCLIIGAGGPMGQMQVIRNICSGARNLAITAVDLEDKRLAALERMAASLASQNGATLKTVNPSRTPIGEGFSYIVILVPSAEFVSQAVNSCAPGAMVNIFAGIPVGSVQKIGLDAVIAKRCYLYGTSGSVLSDMKIVLDKLHSGNLDTNCSVAAVAGIRGAIAGIAAIESRALSGKIVVYPALRDAGLIPLTEMAAAFPSVADLLRNGQWTREAEEEFIRVAGKPRAS